MKDLFEWVIHHNTSLIIYHSVQSVRLLVYVGLVLLSLNRSQRRLQGDIKYHAVPYFFTNQSFRNKEMKIVRMEKLKIKSQKVSQTVSYRFEAKYDKRSPDISLFQCSVSDNY